jgi:uncharacterized cupin superfamily protein
MANDSFIVFAPDVPEEEGHYPPPFDKERLGFFRDIGRALGTAHLGVGLDRLPPGERTSFTHAHSDEEELVYVIDGECHVRLIEPGKPPREVPLRAGHFVSFLAGTRIAHCFVNRGSRDCVTLTIGERKRGVDRALYPEDNEYDEFVKREHPARHWSE